MTPKTIRLAYLLSHPIQYFSPVFRGLAKQAGIDLTVFYCSRQGLEIRKDEKFGVTFAWDVPLLDGYKYKFLESIPRGASPGGPLSRFNPGIVGELRRERYDVLVVHGYTYPTYWVAFAAAKLCGTKMLFRGHASVHQRRSWPKRLVKHLLLRPFFKSLDGLLTIGSSSRQYYRRFGVPAHKMFFVPHSVDNRFFATRSTDGAKNRDRILKRLGLRPDVLVFTYVGKLYPGKAPFDLLVAFAEAQLERAALLFVGEGESRAKLEGYVAKSRVPNVRFTGFLNQTEVPRFYGITDVLVLPSRHETWGLVVNEAMACGCAVVASDACGCAPDLVREGENGCVFAAGDVSALSKTLRQLADEPERVRAMGRASREMIQGWSPRISAKRIAQAVKQVCR